MHIWGEMDLISCDIVPMLGNMDNKFQGECTTNHTYMIGHEIDKVQLQWYIQVKEVGIQNEVLDIHICRFGYENEIQYVALEEAIASILGKQTMRMKKWRYYCKDTKYKSLPIIKQQQEMQENMWSLVSTYMYHIGTHTMQYVYSNKHSKFTLKP